MLADTRQATTGGANFPFLHVSPCVRFCRPVGVEGGEHSPDDVVGEDGRVRLGRAQDQLVHADQEVLLHEHLDRRHVLERRDRVHAVHEMKTDLPWSEVMS